MLTTVRRSRPKGPLRAVPGATNNRKIGGRLCYCDRMFPRLPPQSIQPNRGAGGAWDTWLVQFLCQGARLDLLPPAIHGRRLRQRRPSRLLHMHQNILWMYLVRFLRLFSPPHPSASCRRRRPPAVAHAQPPHSTATQHAGCSMWCTVSCALYPYPPVRGLNGSPHRTCARCTTAMAQR